MSELPAPVQTIVASLLGPFLNLSSGKEQGSDRPGDLTQLPPGGLPYCRHLSQPGGILEGVKGS